MMTRLRRIFSRLRWKLTISYTLVTSAALLVAALALFFLAWTLISSPPLFGRAMAGTLEPAAAELAPLLQGPAPDQEAVQQWLAQHYQDGQFILPQQGSGLQSSLDAVEMAFVVGPAGERLAAVPAWAALQERAAEEAIVQALQGSMGSAGLPSVTGDGRALLLAVPVTGESGATRGALVVQMAAPTSEISPVRETVGGLLALAVPVVLLAGVVGTLFGFVASRSLTRRLGQLSETADAWSQGDFSVFVRDASQDEIGQLARRLNRMAEQLQNLLQTREALATVEERNRLARELHDSVKQQIFATAMQVGAARTLLAEDPEAAARHLAEADGLVRQAQQELTGLIQELRPVALGDRGLAPALRDYLSGWSRQTGIEVAVKVDAGRPLSLAVEQALFRVAQEALANVSRHSGATEAEVHLLYEEEQVTLRVADNGRGFTPGAAGTVGFGVRSMRERLEEIAGTLSVESAPGKGTRVVAQVPAG